MSKFCTKCGTELPNDARFCRGCGAKYEEDIQVDKSVEEEPVEIKYKVDAVKTEKSTVPLVRRDFMKNVNPTVAIIAGMVLVTIIIVVMILTIGRNNSKANNQDATEINEISSVEDENTQSISADDDTQKIEEATDSDISTDTKDQESNEGDNTPDEAQTVEIMNIGEALELFMDDPYLFTVSFPVYGDFISVESKEQFGMAVITSIDVNYAKTYSNEELPKNGYVRNVFENSEDGVYQYIADNEMGQTCQVIYNDGKMMILAGESAAFNR